MQTTVAQRSPPAALSLRRPVALREELEKIAEILALFGVYALIARHDEALALRGHHLDIALDRALPFSSGWIYAYVAFYLFAMAPLLYTRRASWFRRLFAGMAGAMVVAYVVFLAFPTRMVLQPSLAGVPGFTAWLIRNVYAGDGGYNCFPSLHVTLSHLSAWSLGAVDRGVARWAWAVAALITVSTVLLKQHYLADVAAGALLAFVAYRFSLGRFARRSPPLADDHRGRRVLLGLLGIQTLGMLAVWVVYCVAAR